MRTLVLLALALALGPLASTAEAAPASLPGEGGEPDIGSCVFSPYVIEVTVNFVGGTFRAYVCI